MNRDLASFDSPSDLSDYSTPSSVENQTSDLSSLLVSSRHNTLQAQTSTRQNLLILQGHKKLHVAETARNGKINIVKIICAGYVRRHLSVAVFDISGIIASHLTREPRYWDASDSSFRYPSRCQYPMSIFEDCYEYINVKFNN